jgi:hypothetical protein|tara:strand:+ start:799 stop:1056 length:258 start_codon:yes stop_codon:yes gene_type:complete
MKIVKGLYHDKDDNVIGSHKFMVDADDKAIDEKEIHDNAPEGWKCCCWNNSTVTAKSTTSKKKTKQEPVEEMEDILDDMVDFDDE